MTLSETPKFTPGNWVPHYDEEWDTYSVRVENAHEVGYVEICEVGSGDNHRPADMNVLAASKDLYDAVEGLLVLCNPPIDSPIGRLARAALAKARGEGSAS